MSAATLLLVLSLGAPPPMTNVRWIRPVAGQPKVVVTPSRVLLSEAGGRLSALDPRTGATLATTAGRALLAAGDQVLRARDGWPVLDDGDLKSLRAPNNLPMGTAQGVLGTQVLLADRAALRVLDARDASWRQLTVPPGPGGNAAATGPRFVAGYGQTAVVAEWRRLYAADLQAHAVRWDRLQAGRPEGLAVTRHGVVLLEAGEASQSAALLLLDAQTGAEKRRLMLSPFRRAFLSADDDVLLVAAEPASGKLTVTAFNAQGGEQRWTRELTCVAGAAPALLQGLVYVGCGDTVAPLDAATGAPLPPLALWTQESTPAAPAAGKDALYVVHGSFLYALTAEAVKFPPDQETATEEVRKRVALSVDRLSRGRASSSDETAPVEAAPTSRLAWRLWLTMRNRAKGDERFVSAFDSPQPPAAPPTGAAPAVNAKAYVAVAQVALRAEAAPASAEVTQLPSGLEVTVLERSGDAVRVRALVAGLPAAPLRPEWTLVSLDGGAPSDAVADAAPALDVSQPLEGWLPAAALEGTATTAKDLGLAAEKARGAGRLPEALALAERAYLSGGGRDQVRRLLELALEAGDLKAAARARQYVSAGSRSPGGGAVAVALDVESGCSGGQPRSARKGKKGAWGWAATDRVTCTHERPLLPICQPCAAVATADADTKWDIAKKRKAAQEDERALRDFLRRYPYTPLLNVVVENTGAVPVQVGTLLVLAPPRVVERCGQRTVEGAAVAKLRLPMLEPKESYSYWLALDGYEKAAGVGPGGKADALPAFPNAVERRGWEVYQVDSVAALREARAASAAAGAMGLSLTTCRDVP